MGDAHHQGGKDQRRDDHPDQAQEDVGDDGQVARGGLGIIRRKLGVGPADRVAFIELENGRVELRPAPYRVGDLRGIVRGLPGPDTIDFEDLIGESFEAGYRDTPIAPK